MWARWLLNPCHLGDPLRFKAGGRIRGGPLVGVLTIYPRRLGDPLRFRAGGRIRGGPRVGKVATQPLPPRGSPPLQRRGQNQKWPTCGQGGYSTLAASGIPSSSERGVESEVAHLWASWLLNPCRLGDPLRFRGGGRIRSGPLVGKVATSPLPPRGSSPLQSGWQNQKWPTCGQGGYLTHTTSGIPSASERGAESEVAHVWARWLLNPCHLGDPLRFKAGGRIRSGPLVGKLAT